MTGTDHAVIATVAEKPFGHVRRLPSMPKSSGTLNRLNERLVEDRRERDAAQSFHPRAFRDALGRFASGVAVVTTRHLEVAHGMTASAFVSVSLEPPLVLVSLDNRSHMHRILPDVGRYGVSVLAEDQEAFSKHFAGQTAHELDIPFVERRGVPLLGGAVAHFVVEVVDIHPAGDHTLYIGRVDYLETRSSRPLLVYAGGYERIHAKDRDPGE